MWTPRKGAPIHVSKMREGHLEATKRMCEHLALNARFTSESDKWQAWVDVFENELEHRSRSVAKAEPKPVKAPQPVRGRMVWMICACGKHYPAREADLKRGWALSCGKSCAAIRREFGRPAAKRRDK